ncbi:MAG: AAC(3) family N-acetyltransferase, partial [Ruminococcaceae bacterium]|nr:AAC(3) family N-acetyltransferase [Oscillospiraceae bacterium]
GVTSPLDTALKRGGSVVFLGCSIAPNTFLHYLEEVTDAPFMQSAVIRYLDADGEPHTACIPRHLPGDRDFYGDPAKSEFYAEAVERGLKIDAVPFGIGWIYRMELANIYEVGMAMFRDDPVATLCKNPDCAYCASFRSKVK